MNSQLNYFIGWHFITNEGLLPIHYRNGTKSDWSGHSAAVGDVLQVSGTVEPEVWGLHASKYIAQALFWAPGLTLCKVLLSQNIKEGKRKYVANSREVLSIYQPHEIEPILRDWATSIAELEMRTMRIRPQCLLDCIAASRQIKTEVAEPNLKSRCKHLYKTLVTEHQKTAYYQCYNLLYAPGTKPWRTWAARPDGYENTRDYILEAQHLEKMVFERFRN